MTIKELKRRLDRLEKAVFSAGPGGRKKKQAGKRFTGATGGVRLLICKDFFKKARTAPAVRKELEKYEYFYRIQVVQTALNRLSKRRGPLAAFKDSGKKVYVLRR